MSGSSHVSNITNFVRLNTSLSVTVRMPADEDGAAKAKHLYHPLSAVDDSHRKNFSC